MGSVIATDYEHLFWRVRDNPLVVFWFVTGALVTAELVRIRLVRRAYKRRSMRPGEIVKSTPRIKGEVGCAAIVFAPIWLLVVYVCVMGAVVLWPMTIVVVVVQHQAHKRDMLRGQFAPNVDFIRDRLAEAARAFGASPLTSIEDTARRLAELGFEADERVVRYFGNVRDDTATLLAGDLWLTTRGVFHNSGRGRWASFGAIKGVDVVGYTLRISGPVAILARFGEDNRNFGYTGVGPTMIPNQAARDLAVSAAQQISTQWKRSSHKG